ncbi:hypothetical protein CTI12_AA429270 [Artemisia annua]|uniref:Uncharacterized protein n=1 Tax=Artemisia annua TaxID=35608 RepID=A0A2U1LS19_ARTAN|nr:hypothetical protein CTI12_AA429270 [Artemisia annua]
MAEGDVELRHVVDIDQTVRLLLNYDERLQNRSKQHPRSIYMVPSIYRDLSPSSFTPRLVSIGPLHHQDEHLKEFEVQKATYMHNLFHNVLRPLGSTPEQIMKACVTKVRNSVDQIRACYIGMKTYPDSKLVKMMVTDACFILAFIYNLSVAYSSLGQNVLLYTHIFLDMVLIENQIPFFVLQDIYECTFSKLHPRVPLAEFIFKIQKSCNIFEGELEMDNSSTSSTHDHILGFLHKSYQNPDLGSSTVRTMIKRQSVAELDRLPKIKGQSVAELDRSGVRFSHKCDAKWPMAMELNYSRFLCFPLSWSKLTTLKMPVLRIHDHSELFIRNLIVYEQSSGVQACVTSYMYALDSLIDTPEDVAKMVKSQVLVNYLGSDEEAAGVINNICKEVSIRDFYYQNEWKVLDDHYKAYWPNIIAGLRRRYFGNPWSIIALVAGIVLFILTVIQTSYTVKAV